jgi:hypothetical protein
MAVVLAASVSPAQAFKHPNLRNTRFMTDFRLAKLRAAARRPSEAVGARSDRRVASSASNNIDLAQSQVANYNEMSVMLEKLLEEHAQLDEEELTKRVAAVEEMSAELGFNKASEGAAALSMASLARLNLHPRVPTTFCRLCRS